MRSSASPSPSPAPVVNTGKVVSLESILTEERTTRPAKIVIILRGLPGAGKSHLARLIKEKEVEMGGEQPRTMALDDYFECDGEYEYEADMEQSYRANLLKSFKKNIDAGLFQFLLVDAVNDKVNHFREFWSYAKQNGYEVRENLRRLMTAELPPRSTPAQWSATRCLRPPGTSTRGRRARRCPWPGAGRTLHLTSTLWT